jgi:head-tail adaptor
VTSILGLFCHEVRIVRPGTTEDRYGNDAKDWSSSPRRRTVRARVAQRSRSEVGDGREARVTGWVCYLPAGTQVTALDRIEWDGQTFEIKGVPNRAFDRHQEHHLELDLERCDG